MHFFLSFLIQLLDLTPQKYTLLFAGQLSLRSALAVPWMCIEYIYRSYKFWNKCMLENWRLFFGWKDKPPLNWLVVEPPINSIIFPNRDHNEKHFKPPPSCWILATSKRSPQHTLGGSTQSIPNPPNEINLKNWIQPFKRIIPPLAMLRVQWSNTGLIGGSFSVSNTTSAGKTKMDIEKNLCFHRKLYPPGN